MPVGPAVNNPFNNNNSTTPPAGGTPPAPNPGTAATLSGLPGRTSAIDPTGPRAGAGNFGPFNMSTLPDGSTAAAPPLNVPRPGGPADSGNVTGNPFTQLYTPAASSPPIPNGINPTPTPPPAATPSASPFSPSPQGSPLPYTPPATNNRTNSLGVNPSNPLSLLYGPGGPSSTPAPAAKPAGTGTTGTTGTAATPPNAMATAKYGSADDAFSALFTALSSNNLEGYQNAAKQWMALTGYNTLPVWAREEGWNPTTKQFGNLNNGVDQSQWGSYINPMDGQPSMANGTSDFLGNDWRTQPSPGPIANPLQNAAPGQMMAGGTGQNGLPLGVFQPGSNTGNNSTGQVSNPFSVGQTGQQSQPNGLNQSHEIDQVIFGQQDPAQFLGQLASYLSAFGGGGNNLLGLLSQLGMFGSGSSGMNTQLGAFGSNPLFGSFGGGNPVNADFGANGSSLMALISMLMGQGGGGNNGSLYSRSQYPTFP